MNFPKVSIITVTYNAANDLRRTLDNISKIDYPALEVVVIDGASKDNTNEVMQYYRSLITVSVSEPDKGIYDAMNKGIRLSSGDYLWFINAGDLVHNANILKKLLSASNNNADIYYGDTIIKSKDGLTLGLRRKPLPKSLSWRSFRKGMVVCHQSIIVSRRVAPFYDLRYKYSADIEWVLESLKRSEIIVNSGEVLSEFFIGGTSTSHRKESLCERFVIMHKHYGLVSTVISHVAFLFDTLRPAYRKLSDITRQTKT